MGIHSLPARRWGRIGLVALLGLMFLLVTARSNASTWHEASAGHAVAAKKKCKKKHRSASSAKKKKKCKKKKKQVVAPPVTPAAPKPPVVRAEITWSTDADIDVHAWSNGLHDGWDESLLANEAEIPGTTYEPSGSTRERIIDSANPSTVPLTFAVCDY